MSREHIHFVTGKLAEFSLREVLLQVAPKLGFEYTVEVLNITVAALMTTEWIARRLNVPPQATRVLLPGYCRGDLEELRRVTSVPVARGPKDLRRLAEFFGASPTRSAGYGDYDIQILAEINHAPQKPLPEILRMAEAMRADGADVIDIGCNPGETWAELGSVVQELVGRGYKVSVDSMNVTEIEAAARAGASLVLSVNSSNRAAAPDWGCEVVVVPDNPHTLDEMEETIEFLAARNVPLRIDPILEPIGFGFANSLGRYLATREKYPDAEIMMGIGNLTELTDADSAAINVLLLGFCQEQGIRSVLTTQVISWARTSVKECDLARRLVYHAVEHRTLPKHLEPGLRLLRDRAPIEIGDAALARLAAQVKDANVRLFAEGGLLHAISAGKLWSNSDPYALFAKLQSELKTIDASHAFYLGYELAKAVTALTLGKEYRQDEALDWGFLTRPERSHREKINPPTAGE